MVEFCPNFGLIVWKKTQPGTVIMTRLRCKSWGCEYCAKKNRERWSNHLKKRIGRLGGDWWFLTFTASRYTRTQQNSIENLRRGLDLLFKRMRRIWGRIIYVRVYELHEKLAFHAHLILSGITEAVQWHHAKNGVRIFRGVAYSKTPHVWSIKTYLKKTAADCKIGYMVDVQKMDTLPKAVNYVVKYLTKSAQDFEIKGLRRIQTSQLIGSPNERGEGGWNVGYHIWTSDLSNGENIVDLNLKTVITYEQMVEMVAYPPQGEREK